MRSRVLSCATAFAISVASSAYGQAATFSLREALQEARQSNPELVALQRQAESVRAAIPASRSLDPPMAETQIWGWPVNTLNPNSTDMYMFTVEQLLPGRGKRAARERVASEDAQIAQAEIAVRANTILANVKQTFTELFLARASADLLDQQRPLLETMTDAASIRYAAGETGQTDTVKSIVELSRLGVDAIEWRQRARIAEVRLNALLGRAPTATIPALAAAETTTPAAEDAERLALERNPELAMKDAAITREVAELARLRRERGPDFVVGGGYMLQPGQMDAWTARGGITWPNAPWARGRFETGIAVQEKRLAAIRAERDAIALTVRRGVQEALVRFRAAMERITLLDTAVLPNITHALDVATAGYRSNRGAYADLLDSQRLLLSTRMELVAAQAEAQRALADVELAIGLVPEN